MTKSSSKFTKKNLAFIAIFIAILVIAKIIDSIPPCSSYDLNLRLKGCIYKLEAINAAYNLKYSTDGSILLSSGFDAPVYLWSTQDGNLIRVFESKDKDPLQHGALSKDGKFVALYSHASDEITILYTQNWESIKVLGKSQGWSLDFLPDTTALAYNGSDERIHLWSLSEQKDIVIGDASYQTFYISPNGSFLASVLMDKDNEVQLRNLTDGNLARVIQLDSSVSEFAISGDSKFLITVTRPKRDSVVTFWNIATGESEYSLIWANANVTSLTLSPDGTKIALAQKICDLGTYLDLDNRCVTIWNVSDGKELQDIPLKTGVTSLAISPNGEQLAIATEDAIYIWKIK